jgi:hypothetical protein|tara:strand:+ start:640 stop:933 length:294 start_codon:yes stop_codon:yes gene_type:complete
MLVKYFSKIIIILISLILFLSFKDIAKKLETDLNKSEFQIYIIKNQIKKKEMDFAYQIQVQLKPFNKGYIKNKSILIENYLNKTMTIVRVKYDQKSD